MKSAFFYSSRLLPAITLLLSDTRVPDFWWQPCRRQNRDGNFRIGTVFIAFGKLIFPTIDSSIATPSLSKLPFQ